MFAAEYPSDERNRKEIIVWQQLNFDLCKCNRKRFFSTSLNFLDFSSVECK